MKRTFDIVFSIIGLIAMSPMILVLILLIKREDGGPILYKGIRVGRNMGAFKMLKFRTMVVAAERIGGPSTSEDDPRITSIGGIIRKYKLDEIPQLVNVLKGDMSFVGPRPEVGSEVETYTDDEKRIFSVRPGITDWASLKYHNEGEILAGSSDPHKTYIEKIRPGKISLALKYVEERSFFVDMKIIVCTVMTLIKTRSGAREDDNGNRASKI